jgi:hypothetical protein
MPMTKEQAIRGADKRCMGKNWSFDAVFEWLWDRAWEAGVQAAIAAQKDGAVIDPQEFKHKDKDNL